jgi:hypothetical protein
MHDLPTLGPHYSGSIQFPTTFPTIICVPSKYPSSEHFPTVQLLVQQETNSYQPSQTSSAIHKFTNKKKKDERDIRLLNAEIGPCA